MSFSVKKLIFAEEIPSFPDIIPASFAAQLGIMSGNEGIDSAKINFLTEKLIVETSLPEEDVFKLLSECAKSFSKSVKIEK